MTLNCTGNPASRFSIYTASTSARCTQSFPISSTVCPRPNLRSCRLKNSARTGLPAPNISLRPRTARVLAMSWSTPVNLRSAPYSTSKPPRITKVFPAITCRSLLLRRCRTFRQNEFLTAYVEGWALYSERLGKEVGFFQDPYSYYGLLSADMLRAVRLVVDTGIHYKHWTRQQVVDFF